MSFRGGSQTAGMRAAKGSVGYSVLSPDYASAWTQTFADIANTSVH